MEQGKMTMHSYKPLRITLLVYEILRLSAMAFLFAVLSNQSKGLFPYVVHLTPNALFTLMALFLLIRLEEYRNFLPLYTAGKVISVITFYIWSIVSLQTVLAEAYLEMNTENIYPLLSGVFGISLGDLLSILGSWVLLGKIRRTNGGS